MKNKKEQPLFSSKMRKGRINRGPLIDLSNAPEGSPPVGPIDLEKLLKEVRAYSPRRVRERGIFPSES